MHSTRFLFTFIAVLSFAGCSWFGGNDPEPLEFGDPCADRANEFVTQFPNGIGVTSSECVESETGEWIEGRCYCHGSFE